ncbi:MAG: hypothetical protein ACQER7_14320 [Bacteroidota bacterium]
MNIIYNELTNFVTLEESRGFKRTIKDLKQFRLESDYENIEVSLDKGGEALRKAKKIRTYLIKNFKS